MTVSYSRDSNPTDLLEIDEVHEGRIHNFNNPLWELPAWPETTT